MTTSAITSRGHALLCGAVNYANDPATGSPYLPAVEGEEIVNYLKQILLDDYQYHPNDVETLIGDNFEITNLIAHIFRLSRVALPGTKVVLFIHTHGGYIDGSFRMYGHSFRTATPASLILFLLKGFAKGVEVILITDVCQSGEFLSIDDCRAELPPPAENFLLNLISNREPTLLPDLQALLTEYQHIGVSASVTHIATSNYYTDAPVSWFFQGLVDMYESMSAGGVIDFPVGQLAHQLKDYYYNTKWRFNYVRPISKIQSMISADPSVATFLDTVGLPYAGRKDFERNMQHISDIVTFEATLLARLELTNFAAATNKANLRTEIEALLNFYKIIRFDVPKVSFYGPNTTLLSTPVFTLNP